MLSNTIHDQFSKPSWTQSLKVWWSFSWRFGFIISFFSVAILIVNLLFSSHYYLQTGVAVSSFFIQTLASFWALKMTMELKFKGFRIQHFKIIENQFEESELTLSSCLKAYIRMGILSFFYFLILTACFIFIFTIFQMPMILSSPAESMTLLTPSVFMFLFFNWLLYIVATCFIGVQVFRKLLSEDFFGVRFAIIEEA